jgi:hypothetical protein
VRTSAAPVCITCWGSCCCWACSSWWWRWRLPCGSKSIQHGLRQTRGFLLLLPLLWHTRLLALWHWLLLLLLVVLRCLRSMLLLHMRV